MKKILFIGLLFFSYVASAQTPNVLTANGNLVTIPAGGGGGVTLPAKKIAIGNTSNAVAYSSAIIDSATNTLSGLDSLNSIQIINFNKAISSTWATIGYTAEPKFNFTYDKSYTNNDGSHDQVMMWGYNVLGGGGRADSRDSFGIHYAIESKFNSGGNYNSEVHLESNVKGNIIRHFSYLINRATGYTQRMNQLESEAWYYTSGAGTNGVSYFSLDPLASGVTINMPNPTFKIAHSPTGHSFSILPTADGNTLLANNTDGASSGDINFQTKTGGYSFSDMAGHRLFTFTNGQEANLNLQGMEIIGTTGSMLSLSTTNVSRQYYFNVQNGAGGFMYQGLNGNVITYNHNGLASDFTIGGISQHALAIANSGKVLIASGTDDNINALQVTGTANITSKLGIGVATQTARLHLPAGTATAGTAPLKITSGVNLTTPEAGAVEFDGTHYYGTVGTTRYQLDQQGGGTPFITSITNTGTSGAATVVSGVLNVPTLVQANATTAGYIAALDYKRHDSGYVGVNSVSTNQFSFRRANGTIGDTVTINMPTGTGSTGSTPTPVSEKYTPGFTNLTNVSTISNLTGYYSKNGRIVTITLKGQATALAGATAYLVDLSLPFTNDDTNSTNLGALSVSENSGASYVVGEAKYKSTTTVTIRFIPTGTTATNFSTTFNYYTNL